MLQKVMIECIERFASSSYHARPSLLCHDYIQAVSPIDANIQTIYRHNKAINSTLLAILINARRK
jgi:hypothetical protein